MGHPNREVVFHFRIERVVHARLCGSFPMPLAFAPDLCPPFLLFLLLLLLLLLLAEVFRVSRLVSRPVS